MQMCHDAATNARQPLKQLIDCSLLSQKLQREEEAQGPGNLLVNKKFSKSDFDHAKSFASFNFQLTFGWKFGVNSDKFWLKFDF